MAIFESRKRKVLRFLLEENYSNLENLATLTKTPKQTVLRLTKHLCEINYLTKVDVNIGLSRSISVFQPTNTGIMFAMLDNEEIPELREISKVNAVTIYHDLKLQQIRMKLEDECYTGFQSSWQLTKILRKRKEKAPKIPDYTCINPQGDKIAIEYERTIKTKKRYQEIIGQYMDIKERGIIKKVVYYTDHGFAERLKKLFAEIKFIYRKSGTEKCIPEQFGYFEFINNRI